MAYISKKTVETGSKR